MEGLRNVFRELFREHTRVLMTVLAIAWGTASITLMLAIGEGLRDVFGRAQLGVGTSIMVIWPGQTSRPFGGLPSGRPVAMTLDDLAQAAATVPQLADQSPEFTLHRGMRAGERWRTGRVSGVWPAFGSLRNIVPEPGGRFINRLDLEQRRRVVVLGDQSAEELFGEEDPVGKQMEIDGRQFLVIGVMRKKFQGAMYYSPDAMGSFIPATTMTHMWDRPKPQQWIASPTSPDEMRGMETGIRRLLARNHGADPEDPDIVYTWDTQRSYEASMMVFTGIKMVLGIIGGLTLLVAAVGVANTMYLSVRSATREIGVRMAIGARARHIMVPYVLEALLATAAGGLLGLVVSGCLIELIDLVPMEGEFFERIGRPTPLLSGSVALTVVAVLGTAGAIAGFLPARQAAKVDPAQALRYE